MIRTIAEGFTALRFGRVIYVSDINSLQKQNESLKGFRIKVIICTILWKKCFLWITKHHYAAL